MPMTITALALASASFVHNGTIPARHTCDGVNVSPALHWDNIPAGTRSLALIVDDPDAPDPADPRMTWVHWVLYNIPPDTRELHEGVAATALPKGTLQGINDWQRPGYRGPCPPVGNHRYFFKLFALDTVLPNLNQPTSAMLEQAMQGHILARADLVGRYQHR
jgi:Raf kinase inhibitor-like YbhB/YbcL family protein